MNRFRLSALLGIITLASVNLVHAQLSFSFNFNDASSGFNDPSLDPDWQRAITQWLVRELRPLSVTDLSFHWDDRGDYLSWSIPDRHYLIMS